jgi:hypothetical protein
MNGRPLTDAQIARALRAHLPERAQAGLRDRILDAVEGTTQQRALPPFMAPLTDADPVVRRRNLLLVAALLVALALAGVAGVGAWLSQQPGPDELSLDPPVLFVVPGGREWTVTVRNESSDPTTLFVTEHAETGMGRQCGTVTPSVVPPDTTMNVTFLLPPTTVTSCWIWVNPVRGEGGSLFQTSDAPMKGEILTMANGQAGWLSP